MVAPAASLSDLVQALDEGVRLFDLAAEYRHDVDGVQLLHQIRLALGGPVT